MPICTFLFNGQEIGSRKFGVHGTSSGIFVTVFVCFLENYWPLVHFFRGEGGTSLVLPGKIVKNLSSTEFSLLSICIF